jgi:Pvc16 N-terminal domain
MIHDVDESLRELAKRDVINGSRVEISFEAPTRDWSARRNTPTLNFYLYDIREDVSRREVQFEEVRDAEGRVTDRRRPPRLFKLSYLVTAWTQRPEDEHRLLSSTLSCFLRSDVLPSDILQGDLTSGSRPVAVTVALPPGQDRSLSDVWSALGGELKPSLDLIVTAPFEMGRHQPVGPPVLEEPRLTVVGPGGQETKGGRWRDESAPEPETPAPKPSRRKGSRATGES